MWKQKQEAIKFEIISKYSFSSTGMDKTTSQFQDGTVNPFFICCKTVHRFNSCFSHASAPILQLAFTEIQRYSEFSEVRLDSIPLVISKWKTDY